MYIPTKEELKNLSPNQKSIMKKKVNELNKIEIIKFVITVCLLIAYYIIRTPELMSITEGKIWGITIMLSPFVLVIRLIIGTIKIFPIIRDIE